MILQRAVGAMASSKAVVKILCIFLLLLAQKSSAVRISELKKEILDQILPKNPNDILIPPGNATDGPTVVEVFVHVKNIDKVNDEKMEFTVRFLLRQLWKDDRLKYDNKGQIKHIVINDPDAIWTPDIFFSGEKKGHAFDITHPNVFIRIYPEGTVLCSRKLSITFSCPMNLKRFPFDNQVCELRMATYGSTTDDVILQWREYVPVTVSRSLHLPLFTVEKFLTHSGTVNVNTGEYSYLTLSFLLSRTFNYYLYQTFIPCTMLVILTWIPFCLNIKQLTSRLLISVVSLLTCTLMVYDQNKSRPKLSYNTCMDRFIGTCLTLMFVSIVETVIVHKLAEREVKKESKECTVNGHVHKEDNGVINRAKAWFAKIPCKANYIDVAALFVIPLIYIICCVVYFPSGGKVNNNGSTIVGENQTQDTLAG